MVNPDVDDAAQNQLTTQYTERAVSFIERHKDRPFFLYVPHTMVHVPLHVSDKFRGKTSRGLFGDVVEEIDWSVGQILGALKKNGLDERHARDVLFRQRPLAVLRRPCRVGLSAPRGQGDQLGRRGARADAHALAGPHPGREGLRRAADDDRHAADHRPADRRAAAAITRSTVWTFPT